MNTVEIIGMPQPGLGNHSYLVGLGDGDVVVIEPARDSRAYLQAADARGWRLRWSGEPKPSPPPRLAVEQAQQRVAAGAELFDLRPMEDFVAGHVPGSLAIPLRDQFGVWVGWLVDLDRELVPVTGGDEAELDQAVRAGLGVGHERLGGHLPFVAWRDAGRPVGSLPLLTREAAADARGQVLDVRQPEWASGHLAEAVHLELGRDRRPRRRARQPAGGHPLRARRTGHDRRQPVGPRWPRPRGRGRRQPRRLGRRPRRGSGGGVRPAGAANVNGVRCNPRHPLFARAPVAMTVTDAGGASRHAPRHRQRP